jgi:hypothetical protein
MRTQSLNALKGLIKSEVKLLTNQVKETLAFNYHSGKSNEKIFSTADLWSIQRKGRTMISRRRFI